MNALWSLFLPSCMKNHNGLKVAWRRNDFSLDYRELERDFRMMKMTDLCFSYSVCPYKKLSRAQANQNSRRSIRLQETFARINQGEYDNEKSLLNFIRNATTHGEFSILKAAKQRLRKKFPRTYRRYVGPINLRDPLGSKNCYCAIPSSIDSIAHDILNLTVPKEALQCDACWDLDISYAWGVYGQYGAKKIDTETWRTLCGLRGDKKYATA
ncbi:hypothetical protein [Enterovibrio paralichthyis]|uniref:hypothetical protein n=1 Tax=Enterovibrio paralichthyis TaxID=2853805 RepID=UPI001C45865C|nr:hypothetical protein [Enterovibrio paralichthyis]MBV7297146.1 hypothetical protein [Enterovibrio paralichthyis]